MHLARTQHPTGRKNLMEPELTNAEILQILGHSVYRAFLCALLITGPSKEERSKMADIAVAQAMQDRPRPSHRPPPSRISVTLFELVGGFHFGLSERLRLDDVLLITELGELSKAERDAVDVINPIFSVAGILKYILQERHRYGRATLITTEHELTELEALFSPEVAIPSDGFVLSLRAEG
jgi:hypothetical protein